MAAEDTAGSVRQLFQSSLLVVERIEHARDPPGDEYRADRYALNFVDRGTFAVRTRGRNWTIGRREIFVTIPGMDYRCRETDRGASPPGVCLDVCFADASAERLAARVPAIAVGNRRGYLRRRLSAHLETGSDPLAIDLIAGELLESTAVDGGGRAYRAGQLAWYAKRVDRARQAMDDDCASAHSLARLARMAGMSPYHFARVFRELVGLPPHRYLVHRRLETAASRLRNGESVTAACYGAGFGGLSHFITTFRAAYGAPPSVWRSTCGWRRESGAARR
jgi:AraC-like DNA-binding protein